MVTVFCLKDGKKCKFKLLCSCWLTEQSQWHKLIYLVAGIGSHHLGPVCPSLLHLHTEASNNHSRRTIWRLPIVLEFSTSTKWNNQKPQMLSALCSAMPGQVGCEWSKKNLWFWESCSLDQECATADQQKILLGKVVNLLLLNKGGSNLKSVGKPCLAER